MTIIDDWQLKWLRLSVKWKIPMKYQKVNNNNWLHRDHNIQSYKIVNGWDGYLWEKQSVDGGKTRQSHIIKDNSSISHSKVIPESLFRLDATGKRVPIFWLQELKEKFISVYSGRIQKVYNDRRYKLSCILIIFRAIANCGCTAADLTRAHNASSIHDTHGFHVNNTLAV